MVTYLIKNQTNVNELWRYYFRKNKTSLLPLAIQGEHNETMIKTTINEYLPNRFECLSLNIIFAGV